MTGESAPISVGVIGAGGRMGSLTVAAVTASERFRLGARIRRGDTWDAVDADDVLIDFTEPNCVLEHVQHGLELGKHMVVGTSGITAADLRTIERWTGTCPDLGVHVVPNFSVAAVLAHTYTVAAFGVLDSAEIIEYAGPHKRDAPSGTARAVADAMLATRSECSPTADDQEGVPIHSVRLPGIVSRQTTYLASAHEQLSIGFETHSREAFVPGILLALEHVTTRPGLRVGLADLLTR